MPELEGQTAIVTGGSRGVGLAIGRALVEAGARVALMARSEEELGRAAAELGGAVAIAVDVCDPTSVEAAFGRAERELGPADLLVNNAGTHAAIGPLWEVDPSDWWLDVETSLRGASLCSRAVLPGMLERGRGRIVNVSSYAAIRPSPYQSAYAAAKAALISVTESLAASTAERGVAVFAISPGFVRTAMTDHLRQSEEGRRWLPNVGSGGEVDAAQAGRLVVFLASGAADGLSGRFVHVLDDAEDLARRADEVVAEDLYVMRLQKPG